MSYKRTVALVNKKVIEAVKKVEEWVSQQKQMIGYYLPSHILKIVARMVW